VKSLEFVKTKIKIEFENYKDADVVLRSISPEILTAPSERSSIRADIENGNVLRIIINSEDASSLRASLNSFLRWMRLSYDVIKLKKSKLDKDVVKRKGLKKLIKN